MGWLGEYTDPADQSNAEALMVTNRPSAYEVAYDHNYWIYAAIAVVLILLVWTLKKPFLKWFKIHDKAIDSILTKILVFWFFCIFASALFQLEPIFCWTAMPVLTVGSIYFLCRMIWLSIPSIADTYRRGTLLGMSLFATAYLLGIAWVALMVYGTSVVTFSCVAGVDLKTILRAIF